MLPRAVGQGVTNQREVANQALSKLQITSGVFFCFIWPLRHSLACQAYFRMV